MSGTPGDGAPAGAARALVAAADLVTLQLAVPAADPLLRRMARRAPDGASVLDPGHVSFGYPWLPPQEAAACLDDVVAAVAAHPPLEVVLTGPHVFAADARGRVVLHLRPEPADAVHDLADVVADASGHPLDDLTPHCSLVRLPEGADPGPLRRLAADALPLPTVLDLVEVRVRTDGRWSLVRQVRLGAAPRP